MRRADDEHRFRLHHQRSVPSADPATASPSSSSLRFQALYSAERRAHTIEAPCRAERAAEGQLLRGPVPYIGGCAGAWRLLLHSVFSLSPQALMQPVYIIFMI